VRVSIVVPCRNEAAHIGRCLDSILATEHPRAELEVLVVDGRSDDATRTIVGRYATRHPMIRLLDNPQRIVPTALNIGIRAAAGEVILRMDAHAVYPPDYVPKLIEALRQTGADNVGGRVVTLPDGPGPVARAIALALAHPFGVGNSYFRIGARTMREVDTVPFGCYRRDTFVRFGEFDEELVRNQDDEFNHRLVRQGGRVLLVPDVVSDYYARGSLRQLARMYYQYGYFKPLVARKVGAVLTVRQLVPAAFMSSLAATAIWSWFSSLGLVAFTGLAGSYALAVAGSALVAGRRFGLRCTAALAASFVIIHFAYGAGFLRGLAGHWSTRRRERLDPSQVALSR